MSAQPAMPLSYFSGDHQAIAHREEYVFDAWVFVNFTVIGIECGGFFVGFELLGVDHFPAPKNVVGNDDAAGRETIDDQIEIMAVIFFIGIDEHEVDGAGNLRDDVQGVADVQADAVLHAGLINIALNHGREFFVDIDGVQHTAGLKSFCETERRIAGIGADFEDGFGF